MGAQVHELYIDAARFRAGVRKKCLHSDAISGNYVTGIINTEWVNNLGDFWKMRVEGVLRAQYLAEFAVECAHANLMNHARSVALLQQFHADVVKAQKGMPSVPSSELAKLQNPSVVTLSMKRLGKALNDFLGPGA